MGGDSVGPHPADRAAFTPIHHRLGSIDCADWRCRLGLRLAGRPGQTNRLVRLVRNPQTLRVSQPLHHQRHSLQGCGWQTGRMATVRTTRPVYRTAQTRLDPLPCCSRSTLFCQNEFLNPQRWFAIDPAQIFILGATQFSASICAPTCTAFTTKCLPSPNALGTIAHFHQEKCWRCQNRAQRSFIHR